MTTRKYRTTSRGGVPTAIRTPLPLRSGRSSIRGWWCQVVRGIGGLLGQDLPDGLQVPVDVPLGVGRVVDGDLRRRSPGRWAVDLPPHLAARLDPLVQAVRRASTPRSRPRTPTRSRRSSAAGSDGKVTVNMPLTVRPPGPATATQSVRGMWTTLRRCGQHGRPGGRVVIARRSAIGRGRPGRARSDPLPGRGGGACGGRRSRGRWSGW